MIHALGRTSEDYWYYYIKQKVESRGYVCIVPTLPSIKKMNYDSWAKQFDKYKHLIDENSVVIGHSTGSIFLVKYLMENNLKVDKFIGVVSFNQVNKNASNPEWDNINKTFFVPNLKDFKHYAKKRICFYSPTDIYDFESLNKFAETIEAEKVIIEQAGHFTKGYETEFKQIDKYL